VYGLVFSPFPLPFLWRTPFFPIFRSRKVPFLDIVFFSFSVPAPCPPFAQTQVPLFFFPPYTPPFARPLSHEVFFLAFIFVLPLSCFGKKTFFSHPGFLFSSFSAPTRWLRRIRKIPPFVVAFLIGSVLPTALHLKTTDVCFSLSHEKSC